MRLLEIPCQPVEVCAFGILGNKLDLVCDIIEGRLDVTHELPYSTRLFIYTKLSGSP
jgi:transglutaminase/protease-like cytokinesis protein 3